VTAAIWGCLRVVRLRREVVLELYDDAMPNFSSGGRRVSCLSLILSLPTSLLYPAWAVAWACLV